jgi:hypothetical protein
MDIRINKRRNPQIQTLINQAAIQFVNQSQPTQEQPRKLTIKEKMEKHLGLKSKYPGIPNDFCGKLSEL